MSIALECDLVVWHQIYANPNYSTEVSMNLFIYNWSSYFRIVGIYINWWQNILAKSQLMARPSPARINASVYYIIALHVYIDYRDHLTSYPAWVTITSLKFKENV